ncbi:restriction endonuclease subunit S [Mesorhizobium sp. M6A.T.Ce.TU.002.03.1.1]|uniref:restriction endonuclease subunit S n=1 Tax=Mesorhizobium sp. M6A.T.Ce.TU.002.03.1.1 TaxID=2496782 RepID=UPI000FCB92CA|nr:restriction endonuclease subunit S [Mesorhizobium sp. M6A.T.Ce.TU.002.03.1.1]RUU32634.1 restriction endonuclease subunit S [Mesorhizobium sp. M6A.T.Ce.TU.002.03.1.1]
MNLVEVVPDSWIKASVGKYCDVQLGKMLQNDPVSERDELKRYLRAINIAKSGLDLSHDFSMWIKPQEMERFRLKRGDILVSEGGDAGRTAVFNSDDEYYFQNAINRVRPIGDVRILPEFIYYWFTFLKVAGYVEMVCNVATIAHFTAEKVKAAPLALPPLETQRRIARYLDAKTARIDGLIEKKLTLLDRLAEKRQALITRAVTKGLNPDAPMKPSGIDWLGDIPAHWVVSSLGYRYEVQLGRMLNAERSDGDHLKPYLRVYDVQWGKITVDDLPLMDFPPEAQIRYRLRPGDLLVNEGGSYVGRSAIWRGELEECYYQKALHRLRPFHPKSDTAEFLYFLMEMATKNGVFIAGGNQTTIDHLTAEQLRHYNFAFPPIEEQFQITEMLNKKLSEHERLAQIIRISIDLLREFRAATVSSAITGQIAVFK